MYLKKEYVRANKKKLKSDLSKYDVDLLILFLELLTGLFTDLCIVEINFFKRLVFHNTF